MVTYLDIELRLRKLSGRLTVARILLILGWIAVLASLPMGMFADEFAYPWGVAKVYPTWTIITSPYLVFFTIPLFLGLAAGTVAGAMRYRVRRSWPFWVCRASTVGLLLENLTAAGAVCLIALFHHPSSGATNASRALSASEGGGFGAFFLALGSLLIGLSPWIIPIPRRKSVSPSEGSAPSTGGE